ncbi:flagellar basal body-associated FliL family protein [Nocardioides campestrisoli]|uniref:flagellar basal body-associated FliL family protein n=1 Tax=Nocardioides campestrisoli TaxID=2736757 RepID=UPI002159D9CF|nr:flagellar basal body-associated FliL family protein [Nocardioides campestrisoli]
MTVTAMPPAPAGQAPAAPEEPEKKSRKKLLLVLVLVLAVGGAGWFFFLKPSGPSEPVPGEVMALESMQLNLAGGHYLRLGLALQLEEGAHEVDGSKAMDAAISIFSGLEMSALVRGEQREELRGQLLEKLDHAYHGEVLEVYYTEFVTQ